MCWHFVPLCGRGGSASSATMQRTRVAPWGDLGGGLLYSLKGTWSPRGLSVGSNDRYQRINGKGYEPVRDALEIVAKRKIETGLSVLAERTPHVNAITIKKYLGLIFDKFETTVVDKRSE